MATSYIAGDSMPNRGDFPNGLSAKSVANGFYRVVNGARPSEGVPTNFDYAFMMKTTVASGYHMIILADIYGRLAVYSTQNNQWVVH